MQVVNIGSINIDHVYAVHHFVRPGETLTSEQYSIFPGGKGFNQSIALARAGARVRHTGAIGRDGTWLLDRLERDGIDFSNVKTVDAPTGHAIIQVVPTGENAIVLQDGANGTITTDDVDQAAAACSPGDFLLLQNETSSVAQAIAAGERQGLHVVFNPAPMSPAIRDYPLQDVDIFVINETEAEGLTGHTSPQGVRSSMASAYPRAATVLTLGRRGAAYLNAAGILRQPAVAVDAVDTTAAGDTFTGYFLAEIMRSGDPTRALALGCRAAAICVTRHGASDSIPSLCDLDALGLGVGGGQALISV